MKKLLLILFLSISQITSADDEFSGFQVLDMRVGDSLLNYMTEDEILDGIEVLKDLNRYSHLKEPNKFLEILVPRKNYLYDKGSVFVKNTTPSSYTIQAIRGFTDYIEDFDACIKRRNQIVEILTNMFPDVRTGPFVEEDNEGIMDKFSLGNSEVIIDITCDNLEETYRLKNNFTEGLSVIIRNEEFSQWGVDYK